MSQDVQAGCINCGGHFIPLVLDQRYCLSMDELYAQFDQVQEGALPFVGKNIPFVGKMDDRCKKIRKLAQSRYAKICKED